jgi:predicted negative regulator of RcsB-dependent stress response
MRKFIFGLLKIFIVIVVAGISYHYYQLHQDNKMLGADHPKEIGKATGKAVKGIKNTTIKIKNSKQVKDLKDSFKDEYTK